MRHKVQILLLDMTNYRAFSGVDRYMEMVVEALRPYLGEYAVTRVSFVNGGNLLGCKASIIEEVQYISFPLPQMAEEVIRERYWLRHYNTQVMHLLSPYITSGASLIIHTHTINLIDLALLLRQQYPCSRIISHLHCIPWKSIINRNEGKFNQLYRKYVANNVTLIKEEYLTNNCEEQAYLESDYLVCLTQCAEDFLRKMYPQGLPLVYFIPNGVNDLSEHYARNYDRIGVVRVIYVGTISRGKGLELVLQALRLAQKERNSFEIAVAGFAPTHLRNQIESSYSDLNITFKGTLSRDAMMELYKWADVGVIASLQEQCSYVALEMAMMGLPIITTSVDGLDEIFTHRVNALKVNVSFSRALGLIVDLKQMAQYLIELATSRELRKDLGTASRKLYLERYNIDLMRTKTLELYRTATKAIGNGRN